MRSGKAAAMCNASTSCAPCRRRPTCWTLISPRSAKSAAPIASSTAHVAALKDDLANINDFEAHARDLCDRLALGLQASVVVRHAPAVVADAFCRSRLESRGAHHYGALPRGVDSAAIVKRAAPR